MENVGAKSRVLDSEAVELLLKLVALTKQAAGDRGGRIGREIRFTPPAKLGASAS